MGRRMSRRQPVSLPSRMMREVRKAEATARENNAGDTGTGQTILRLNRHQPPLRTLLDGKKISAVELHAAEQIALAVTAVSTRGILSAALLERVDWGQSGRDWPYHVAVAVRNYQQWANHWSKEWKRTRNPMSEIIWSAVIDERPISVIAQEVELSHYITERAIVCGLRHYAAHAGLVTGNDAREWRERAQGLVFKVLVAPTS